MTLNPLDWLRKRKKRQQNVLFFTEDSRIVQGTLSVERGYVVDESGLEAYFLDSDALRRRKGDRVPCLPVCEASAVPLYFASDKDRAERLRVLKPMMTQIARESLRKTQSNLTELASKDKLAETLRFLAILFAIIFVLLIMAGLISSGNLHLPW